MKITLEIEHVDGIRVRACAKPLTPEGKVWNDSPYVFAEGACPGCKADPFKVRGTGGKKLRTRFEDGERITSPALCLACEECVGILVAEPQTLFGSEEDRAVLQGRCRVY